MNSLKKIDEVVTSLQVVYPRSFPTDPQQMKALIAVWYNDLGHIPATVLESAAQYLRRSEDWPTIAAMWRSIRAVADVPSAYIVKEALEAELEKRSKGELSSIEDPILRQIWNSLGGFMGIKELNQTSFEINFQREYEAAAKEWFENATKPENVHLLTEVKQIEG